MRGYTQAEVVKAFQHLGITEADVMGIRSAPSLVEANKRLQALRDRVKKQWRKLAFELHPDRTEGDEDKEKLFKLLSGVVDKLDDTKVLPPMRPRPRPRRRVVWQQPIMWTDSTNATSTSTGHWVHGGFVSQVWVNGRRVA